MAADQTSEAESLDIRCCCPACDRVICIKRRNRKVALGGLLIFLIFAAATSFFIAGGIYKLKDLYIIGSLFVAGGLIYLSVFIKYQCWPMVRRETKVDSRASLQDITNHETQTSRSSAVRMEQIIKFKNFGQRHKKQFETLSKASTTEPTSAKISKEPEASSHHLETYEHHRENTSSVQPSISNSDQGNSSAPKSKQFAPRRLQRQNAGDLPIQEEEESPNVSIQGTHSLVEHSTSDSSNKQTVTNNGSNQPPQTSSSGDSVQQSPRKTVELDEDNSTNGKQQQREIIKDGGLQDSFEKSHLNVSAAVTAAVDETVEQDTKTKQTNKKNKKKHKRKHSSKATLNDEHQTLPATGTFSSQSHVPPLDPMDSTLQSNTESAVLSSRVEKKKKKLKKRKKSDNQSKSRSSDEEEFSPFRSEEFSKYREDYFQKKKKRNSRQKEHESSQAEHEGLTVSGTQELPVPVQGSTDAKESVA